MNCSKITNEKQEKQKPCMEFFGSYSSAYLLSEYLSPEAELCVFTVSWHPKAGIFATLTHRLRGFIYRRKRVWWLKYTMTNWQIVTLTNILLIFHVCFTSVGIDG